jgi:CheY-like chemotaxis protein/HPt (histidine-containing phosphotransfer) domain-containing protein
VNRKLVTTLLRKRGHTVKTVENGRLAVEAVTSDGDPPFDVGLMDVEMPEMDGLEAARAIRDHESQGDRRLPLIALTAHAMQGDRDRCIEAGLDAYLSKPIDVDELIAAVERYTAGTVAAPPAIVPQATVAIFDERAALGYAGGDHRLLAEVVRLFRADYPKSLRRIDRALQRRDPEALRLAAHSLKGSAATVGAPASRQAAAELETNARDHDFDRAAGSYAKLSQEIERLENAFAVAGLTSPTRQRAARQARRAPRRKQRPS